MFADPSQWQWRVKIPQSTLVKYAAAIAGAVLVRAIGKALAARQPPAEAA